MKSEAARLVRLREAQNSAAAPDLGVLDAAAGPTEETRRAVAQHVRGAMRAGGETKVSVAVGVPRGGEAPFAPRHSASPFSSKRFST